MVRERLRGLRQSVRNLREVRAVSKEEFVASYRHYWLGERGLQLAAEALFDIGNHLLSGHFNVHATDYEDVVRRLRQQGVLSVDLAARLAGLGGFRNLLVHEYLQIDVGRVYDALHEELDVFELFAVEVESFLEAREG